jgi:signal transduction histidine kinase
MNPDPAGLAHLRHELRTPLNHILGYSEMLLEDARDAELAGELRRIRDEGRALLAVVEEALAPARTEGGGPDLGRLASALSGPLDRLAEAVDRLARLASEGDAGTVAADARRIAGAVARLRALVEGWGADPGPAPAAAAPRGTTAQAGSGAPTRGQAALGSAPKPREDRF